ncbi:MAG TPA: hypothetical protein VN325_44150 [Steroidobacteraceae bacterium]|nr:hypothetical protein [Steroidobacteraceae bacterium]
MSKPKKNNLAPVTSIALRRDGLHVMVLGRTVKTKAALSKPKSLEHVSYDELQKLMDEHFACVSYDETPDWRSMPKTDPPEETPKRKKARP